MGNGATPQEAIHQTLSRLAQCWPLKKQHQVAFVATTPDGDYAGGSLRPGFKYTVCDGKQQAILDPEVVLHN
jgi:hypothetical protein